MLTDTRGRRVRVVHTVTRGRRVIVVLTDTRGRRMRVVLTDTRGRRMRVVHTDTRGRRMRVVYTDTRGRRVIVVLTDTSEWLILDISHLSDRGRPYEGGPQVTKHKYRDNLVYKTKQLHRYQWWTCKVRSFKYETLLLHYCANGDITNKSIFLDVMYLWKKRRRMK